MKRRAAPPAARKPASATAADATLRLTYRPPYDWPHMSEFLNTRALPGIERVDSRGYARTVRLSSGPAIVHVRPVKSARSLELRVSGAPRAALFQLSVIARRMFDLAADPGAVTLAFAADPLLASVAREHPGLRIPGAWDPFECAVRAILGQQVSVAAGRTLAARLVKRAGTEIAAGAEGLTHLFPSPAELEADSLEGLGITGARVKALRSLARAVLDGHLDFSAPAAEVETVLASLPGIGTWTAQYISLRALGEPDAFLSGDLILRRMAGGNGPPLSARLLEARAERWRPWRSYAVIYLWRLATQTASAASKLNRIRIRPAKTC